MAFWWVNHTCGLQVKEPLTNPITRHPGESRDPVTFAQLAEMQKRWALDIASRLRLQDCKRERRRRRVARAPWMARVFRDDEQNQGFPKGLQTEPAKLCIYLHICIGTGTTAPL